VPLTPSNGAFHRAATVRSFPCSKVPGRGPHSCLLGPACLCTVPWGRAPSSLSLFSLGSFFCFFPGRGSVCPVSYADLSQGVLCAAYSLTWWSPKQFNVAGWSYVWAGGVEVLEFCLFLVVFPSRCSSSVSPRVYFRKHAFCFLPLVAILKSPLKQS
jgi:hypothetical protein